MMQTVQIKIDGKMRDVKPSKGKMFSLLELQTMVNGLIQLVDLSKRKVFMVINQEGKLLSLPTNDVASALYDEEFGKELDEIVGDVVLIQYNEFTAIS